MKDINLMPEEVKESSVINEKFIPKISFKKIIITLVLLLIIIVSFLIPQMFLYTAKEKINKAQKVIESEAYTEITAINNRIGEYRTAIAGKNEVIDQIAAETYPVSCLLGEIERSLPKGCNLSSVEYDSKTVKISGIANSVLDAAQIMVNINRLDFINSEGSLEDVSVEKLSPKYKYEYNLSFSVGRKEGK